MNDRKKSVSVNIMIDENAYILSLVVVHFTVEAIWQYLLKHVYFC
jgi:hypothetical protein